MPRFRLPRTFVALVVAIFSLLLAPTTAVLTAPAAQASTLTDTIVSLARANLGKQYCSQNSRGGWGFETSCNGEAWCADFAKWVWRNAGVAYSSELNAAAASFGQYGSRHGTLATRPSVGDAVVYNWNWAGYADHVGIVTAVRSDGSIEVINGNFGSSSTTSRVTYSYSGANAQAGSWIAGQQVTRFVHPVGSGSTTPPVGVPQNCPAGWVCVYPGTDITAVPSLKYYDYGTFNFYNQWGNKVIYNNQTGGAKAYLFTGVSGTGTSYYIAAGTWRTFDFGPLNSIRLTP